MKFDQWWSTGPDYNRDMALAEAAWDNALIIERVQYCANLEAAVLAERERCCGIVYGMCSSDNTAARIVEAIRNDRKN